MTAHYLGGGQALMYPTSTQRRRGHHSVDSTDQINVSDLSRSDDIFQCYPTNQEQAALTEILRLLRQGYLDRASLVSLLRVIHIPTPRSCGPSVCKTQRKEASSGWLARRKPQKQHSHPPYSIIFAFHAKLQVVGTDRFISARQIIKSSPILPVLDISVALLDIFPPFATLQGARCLYRLKFRWLVGRLTTHANLGVAAR